MLHFEVPRGSCTLVVCSKADAAALQLESRVETVDNSNERCTYLSQQATNRSWQLADDQQVVHTELHTLTHKPSHSDPLTHTCPRSIHSVCTTTTPNPPFLILARWKRTLSSYTNVPFVHICNHTSMIRK